MASPQRGQGVIEWAVMSLVLVLFGFGMVGVGQAVDEYTAVREAASQAALAAARAPSDAAAQQAGAQAATEAVKGSGIEDFRITIDTHGFKRGGIVTATVSGYADLQALPVAGPALGGRIHLQWRSSALIEPYRSRSAA